MRRFPPLVRYLFALLVTGAALILTKTLQPFMSYYAFDLFHGAVFLSAWFGGFGAGLLTLALSIPAMNYFLMPPIYTFRFSPLEIMHMVIFGGVGFMVNSLSARLRAAQMEVQKERDDLERRLQERTQEVLSISGHEQERIGQDLHDGLCQTLAGIRLLTAALFGKLSSKADATVPDVEKIEARLEQAQAQAQAVSHGLYPVELETEGLMFALQELADRTQEIYSVACRFTCRKSVLVQDHVLAVHVYRIVQEAVMNAIKGGKAKRISIRLMTANRRHLIAVSDNGTGFVPDPARRGMGLKIMDYRARTIGAKLKFKSRPKGGTSVIFSFDQNHGQK